MSEMRAGDLEVGLHIRLIGESDYTQIVSMDVRPDTVLIDVWPGKGMPYSLPPLDHDTAVEVQT